MSNFDILTSQNVSVNYTVAGLGNRIAATLIDSVIVGLYVFAIMVFVPSMFDSGNPFLVFALFLPVMLYSLLMEVFFNGQSIGKMMMKIRVVKTDGSQPTLVAYLLRWMFRLIEILVSGGSIAVILIAFTEKSQRLGDLAAGTTVIKLTGSASLRELVPVQRDENYEPVFSEVMALSDKDMQLLKKVKFRHSKQFAPALEQKMADHIKKNTGIVTDLSNRKFLQTVYSDYEYYSLKDSSTM